MPVAPLPDELVDLILDHLDAVLDETKRREIGLRVSLVCKKWRPLGHGLAWRSLTVRTRDDDAFLEDLLAHPAAVKEIRKLYFVPAGAQTEDGDPAARGGLATAVTNILPLRLIEACSNQVVVLHTPVCTGQIAMDVLQRASCAALAPSLRRLTLLHAIDDEFDPTDFATSLTRFQSLRLFYLDLSLHFLRATERPLAVTPETDGFRVPLKRLALLLVALADVPGAGQSVADLLNSVLNPHTLKSITLPEYTPELLPIEWLAKFTHLCRLVIIAPSIIHLMGSFARIANRADKPVAVSPVSLATLLRSLPATLESARIGGLIFELAHGTPTVQYDAGNASQLPVGALIWLQTAADGEGSPIRARLLPVSIPPASTMWCLATTPSHAEESAASDPSTVVAEDDDAER
ncbi:hypothetical protein JCM10450v2_006373 [Rhodotorula kratochvilovae]